MKNSKTKLKNKVLSKSKLMRGVQCPKNLWLNTHRPDLESSVDAATQMQFDEGNEVGELARELEGKGILIDNEYWDYDGAHASTQDAIKNGETTIFEASFRYQDYFARADILKKEKRGWDLIEVKKSTEVKDYHFQDAAIQTFIIESSGVKINKISIRHINNKCVFPDLTDLFKTTDVTVEVRSILTEITKQIGSLKKSVESAHEPEIKIGAQCDEPFECAFKEYCWKGIPENSVFDLPNVRTKEKWKLYNKKLVKMTDLDPNDYEGLVKRVIEVTISKKQYIDSKAISEELSTWEWPLYFFDFETISPAIPRYKKANPYTKIPFQFSCHVWPTKKSTKIEHFEYLHTESSDPRPKVIKAMLDGLGTKGSIVAYNKSFEITAIKKLAEFDSKNKAQLLALTERFVDPRPIIKDAVYHPDFHGSFSIKDVAPALLGEKLSYEHLEVGDGNTAQVWAEQILRGKIKSDELTKVRDSLLEYCRQDTLAMVELVKWMMDHSMKD